MSPMHFMVLSTFLVILLLQMAQIKHGPIKHCNLCSPTVALCCHLHHYRLSLSLLCCTMDDLAATLQGTDQIFIMTNVFWENDFSHIRFPLLVLVYLMLTTQENMTTHETKY